MGKNIKVLPKLLDLGTSAVVPVDQVDIIVGSSYDTTDYGQYGHTTVPVSVLSNYFGSNVWTTCYSQTFSIPEVGSYWFVWSLPYVKSGAGAGYVAGVRLTESANVLDTWGPSFTQGFLLARGVVKANVTDLTPTMNLQFIKSGTGVTVDQNETGPCKQFGGDRTDGLICIIKPKDEVAD